MGNMFRSCILSLDARGNYHSHLLWATNIDLEKPPRESLGKLICHMSSLGRHVCQVPQIVEQKRVQHRHVEQFVAWLWGFHETGGRQFHHRLDQIFFLEKHSF